MARKNKTISNLQTAWDNLDLAYENIEKAFEILCNMNGLSLELLSELDRFDITEISSIKQHVESLIENLKSKE